MTILLENLINRSQLTALAPLFTKNRVQYWLAANLDGFRDRCTFKISRRVLFDLAAIEAWLDEHRSHAVGDDA